MGEEGLAEGGRSLNGEEGGCVRAPTPLASWRRGAQATWTREGRLPPVAYIDAHYLEARSPHGLSTIGGACQWSLEGGSTLLCRGYKLTTLGEMSMHLGLGSTLRL